MALSSTSLRSISTASTRVVKSILQDECGVRWDELRWYLVKVTCFKTSSAYSRETSAAIGVVASDGQGGLLAKSHATIGVQDAIVPA